MILLRGVREDYALSRQRLHPAAPFTRPACCSPPSTAHEVFSAGAGLRRLQRHRQDHAAPETDPAAGAEQGLRTGIIKHAHHDFDTDIPGKDSYELRKAGARQVLVASARRWALITETREAGDPDLDALIARLDPEAVDLVLVEGFRHVPFPRIELHRQALGNPLLHPYDPAIIAVACDYALDACALPVLDLNDIPPSPHL